MKITRPPGYTRSALAFLAVLLIFLVILDSLIYFWEQEALFEDSYNGAQNELELIGTFVTEPLLRHEFTMVEQFMIQWGELKKDVVSLKAITPNGLLLAEFRRPNISSETFTKSFSVKFSEQHLLDVEIIKDLAPAILHLQDFKRRLVINSVLLTMFIGMLLWYTLKLLAVRPLEKEIKKRKQAEENIQKAHNRLEELVAERTKQLRESNIELQNEIFEKNKMQEELLKAKKLESVSVLAGGIAHDFNNILTAIMGNINLALLYTDHDDKRHNLLTKAEKASLRAKDLTQQLLTFSRGGEPVKRLASIEEVIRDSAGFVLRGSKVRCDYHFAEGLLPVEIDSGQISQVIQNIIINASHAMPDGGVIDVTCENCFETPEDVILSQSAFHIKIAIQDRGIGIPPTLIDKIFDPYFSTKREGNGLGLAICHSIVSKHNGQISAESVQGVGSTFTIYLPALKGKQLAGKKEKEVIRTRDSGKVLVMDDEEMIRDIALEMLSYLGFQVVLANDGAEAIEVYQKNLAAGGKPFDIVIMDLTIPGGMGGSKAIKKILTLNPQAKVIVSSGYSNDPVMANYMDHGFSGVITKPFKINELSEAIHKVLVD
jgi:signal transduction histidine kinase/CheY-like chemotaxis protein